MPTRELLSPAQRAQFLSIPAEMNEQIRARYYTLSPEDLARIRRHRRSHNKLGFAVQLAYLRFPGRTWTASEEASSLIVSYSQPAQGQSDGDCAVCCGAGSDPVRTSGRAAEGVWFSPVHHE